MATKKKVGKKRGRKKVDVSQVKSTKGRTIALYTSKTLDDCYDYIENYETYGHPFPSLVGMCSVTGVGRTTYFGWKYMDDKPEMNIIMDHLNEVQELVLLNKSITNQFNSTMAKLMLTKHGYADKVDNTLAGPGGGPVQTETKTLTVTGVESKHPDSK